LADAQRPIHKTGSKRGSLKLQQRLFEPRSVANSAKIKNMGNAGRNGGEYYTPRPLIRAIVRVVKPEIAHLHRFPGTPAAGFGVGIHPV